MGVGVRPPREENLADKLYLHLASKPIVRSIHFLSKWPMDWLLTRPWLLILVSSWPSSCLYSISSPYCGNSTKSLVAWFGSQAAQRAQLCRQVISQLQSFLLVFLYTLHQSLPFLPLTQHFLKCSSKTSSVSITWDLIRNANS